MALGTQVRGWCLCGWLTHHHRELKDEEKEKKEEERISCDKVEVQTYNCRVMRRS